MNQEIYAQAARLASERLLQLAPAELAPLWPELQPLLQAFYTALQQGKEPLLLPAGSLSAAVQTALGLLPLQLCSGPGGELQLWRQRSFKQRQRLVTNLAERLRSQAGLLLSGGAGTGKTTLIKELLQDCPPPVLLMAPTGKAAARLREALSPLSATMACGTLHRWLEAGSDGSYRRHAGRPLAAATVVVDEFSMVDGDLTDALLEALPATVKLFLVGDPGQLPPISGPSVLDPLMQLLAAKQPESLRLLSHSHRFDATTALGRFVQLLRSNCTAQSLQAQLEQTGKESNFSPNNLSCFNLSDCNLAWHNLALQKTAAGWPQPLLKRIELHKQELIEAATDANQSDAEVLALLDKLLVLSPRRSGSQGVERLNESWLGIDRLRPGSWPVGTPLIVGRNDINLGLANGDRGILRAGSQGQIEALIATADGPQRHPLLLVPAAEPALALTVHKSQGSQAEAVIMVLPEGELSDRRLLYTALSRAQKRADLLSPPLRDPEALSGG
jgi:exodeoxyribonuclease V alpha subunit